MSARKKKPSGIATLSAELDSAIARTMDNFDISYAEVLGVITYKQSELIQTINDIKKKIKDDET